MIRQMLVTSLLVAFALPAAAQNTCDAGKLKCLRNKLSCLIKVHESSQKKGLPPDAAKLQKCMDKFDGGAVPERGCFAKLEAKQDVAKPATVCSKTGDTAAAEANVDAYVAGLLSLINATTPSTTTTTIVPTCNANLLTCQAAFQSCTNGIAPCATGASAQAFQDLHSFEQCLKTSGIACDSNTPCNCLDHVDCPCGPDPSCVFSHPDCTKVVACYGDVPACSPF